MLGRNGKNHEEPEVDRIIGKDYKPDLIEDIFQHSETRLPKPKNAYMLYRAQQEVKEDKENGNR